MLRDDIQVWRKRPLNNSARVFASIGSVRVRLKRAFESGLLTVILEPAAVMLHATDSKRLCGRAINCN